MGKMNNFLIYIALLTMALLGSGPNPAWSIDSSKLPPASYDRVRNLEIQKMDKSKLPGSGCIPRTCEEAGAYCGQISDGCGKVLDCGIAKQASATVDLPQYTGVCPKTFKFTGTITTHKKGKVCYSFYNNYSFDAHSAAGGKSGELFFDGPGTKQVFYEWAVPIKLPPAYHYVLFSASGAPEVKVPFQMKCTQVFKPGGGTTLDPKQ
jgi:hypothetical protein